jgi:type IV secretion system protein VirB2
MTKFFQLASIAAVVAAVVLAPGIAHAQSVDPTTIVTQILAYVTGPFGRAAGALAVAAVGFACIIGHHPMAGIGILLVGVFLIFGAQFFVQSFVGG